MMGKASRDKGARFERALVNLLISEGVSAERVPLSGAAGGSYCGDLTVAILGRDRKFEAKKRENGSGFKLLYSWLADNFGLFVAADRQKTLVVLPVDNFIWLLQRAEQARVEGSGNDEHVRRSGNVPVVGASDEAA